VKITDDIKKYRNAITIVLALSGIMLIFYYNYCDTACSYLKGDIWDIDLKWVGIVYMAVIIAFASFRQTPFVRVLLAAGLGVEVHLYAFQVQNDVYCPFCLAFSVVLILAFIINYEVPSAWRENRRRMWLYFLGEVDFLKFRIHKLPLLLFSLLGYLTILFSFSGSVTPAYGQEATRGVPSLGKGAYEVVIFTDYFCLPCRRIDTKAESLLKELLATKKVKITFVDVSLHRATPIYAKYYLYVANVNADANSVFYVRRLLFDAAQIKHIQTEDALVNYLTEQKISWKVLNEKSIFPIMSDMIKENKVDATLTRVIKYTPTDIKKYVGDDKIWDGLKQLKAFLTIGKK